MNGGEEEKTSSQSSTPVESNTDVAAIVTPLFVSLRRV